MALSDEKDQDDDQNDIIAAKLFEHFASLVTSITWCKLNHNHTPQIGITFVMIIVIQMANH